MGTPARRTNTLPTPASLLAIQIVQAAVRPNVTLAELVGLCQRDPALAARLLSYVNSAGMALGRKVASVQHAVALLGVRGTRNLALTTCVGDMTPAGEDGDVVLGNSLRRAIACRLAAASLGKPGLDDYFTTGLLLETGFLLRAREDLKATGALARSPAAARVMMERAAGHEDHARLGARLAKSWHLDDEMAAAIGRHHDADPPGTELGAVAWLAERLAGVFEGGDIAATRLCAVEAAVRIGMSAEAADEILRSIPALVREQASAFRRDLGPQPELDVLMRDANACLVEINRNYAELTQQLESLLREKETLASQLAAANDRLTRLSLQDELTGLGNLRAFQEALVRDLARADRQREPLSLVIVSMDPRESYEAEPGTQLADEVFRAIAQDVHETVRASDVAARVGAEALALLLPSTGLPGANIVAERLRKRVADARFGGARRLRVTVTLGIATTRGPGCRGLEQPLYELAGQAVAAGRTAGGDRCNALVLKPQRRDG